LLGNITNKNIGVVLEEEEDKNNQIELVEGMAGSDDVDSLLNAPVGADEYGVDLSHIEEDNKYVEEVQDKGIEYDTDDS